VSARPSPDATLRTALAGVRAVLLDLDGVLILRNEPVPGAFDAVASLRARRIPFRVMTNTSGMSRTTLASLGRSVGLDIPADHIISSLTATAAYTARTFPGRPLYVLAAPDARTEFAGQWLLADEEADAAVADAFTGGGPSQVAAVVIGDAPDQVSYATLNRAFRLVRDGAALLGMHRNRWWILPDGPRLDSGAIVAGLEYALERPARILGKPSREFFREGMREVAADLRAAGDGRRLVAHDVLMVGDDLWSDVLGAQRAGLRGALVLTGKHGQADVERADAQGRGGRHPDAIAPSLAELVAALD
jgi:HAD superfamily hydrolase (TIGR01450 family)